MAFATAPPSATHVVRGRAISLPRCARAASRSQPCAALHDDNDDARAQPSVGGGASSPLASLVPRAARALAATAATAAVISLVTAGPLTALAAGDSLESGAKLFEMNCAGCHPGGGNIIAMSRGKSLKSKALARYGFNDKDSITALMKAGKGAMPNYSSKLSDNELDGISQFVLDQAAINWK